MQKDLPIRNRAPVATLREALRGRPPVSLRVPPVPLCRGTRPPDWLTASGVYKSGNPTPVASTGGTCVPSGVGGQDPPPGKTYAYGTASPIGLAALTPDASVGKPSPKLPQRGEPAQGTSLCSTGSPTHWLPNALAWLYRRSPPMWTDFSLWRQPLFV